MVMDFIQGMARRMPWQRGIMFQMLTSAPASSRFPTDGLAYPGIRSGFSTEASMRAMNHFYDAQIAIGFPIVYFPSGRRETNALYAQATAGVHQFPLSILWSDWPMEYVVPSVSHIVDTSDSAVMGRKGLTEVSLALAAFKAEHAAYPAKLEVVVPNELKTLPDDLFTDEPLNYTRTEAGYVLYSVGPNLKDDGGKTPISDYLRVEVP